MNKQNPLAGPLQQKEQQSSLLPKFHVINQVGKSVFHPRSRRKFSNKMSNRQLRHFYSIQPVSLDLSHHTYLFWGKYVDLDKYPKWST